MPSLVEDAGGIIVADGEGDRIQRLEGDAELFCVYSGQGFSGRLVVE